MVSFGLKVSYVRKSEKANAYPLILNVFKCLQCLQKTVITAVSLTDMIVTGVFLPQHSHTNCFVVSTIMWQI